MALIDQVQSICNRLAPLGWREFLRAATGGTLDIQQATAATLKTQLTRDLPVIDRTLPGLADFSMAGRQAITAGNPARSLLYHALANPLVNRDHQGSAFGGFANPAELDVIENFIFGVTPLDLNALIAIEGAKSNVGVVIFSYEYRPAADSVDGRHADLSFSRTGVARVGTADARYLPAVRGFWPEVETNPNRIRVIPAKFSAWIAVKRKGAQTRVTPILDNNEAQKPAEPTRDFWVPVHKLFPGTECVAGQDLAFALTSRLFNLKIQRIHRHIKTTPLPSGFPYVLEDAEIGAFALDGNLGPGWLVPTVHPALVERAVVDGKLITYKVTPSKVNDFATFAPGAPGLPEYVHARTRVVEGVEEDLNRHEDLLDVMKEKPYEALHYIDFTGEGWVTLANGAKVGGLAIIPAYALVSAPDFVPSSGQYELSEWSRSKQVPPAFRGSLWNRSRDPLRPNSLPPTPLSETRLPANLQLPNHPFASADTSITAVVGMGSATTSAPIWPIQPDILRASALPDDAAGVFAPGWDVAVDEVRVGNKRVRHLAGYVLGSPFPEDAKLCAALSTFWPAVAPDIYRTFVKVVGNTNGTIAPLTDEEIGQGGGTLPWDGIPGPREVTVAGREEVEFPTFLNADYVQQAVENRFSIRLTGQITVEQYQERIIAACRAYSALSSPGNIQTERNRWLMLSFRSVVAGDAGLQSAQNEAGIVLQGNVYAVRLCLTEGVSSTRVDARTERIPLRNDTRLYVSATTRNVLLKRSTDLRFGFKSSE